eukprot:gene9427-12703_t
MQDNNIEQSLIDPSSTIYKTYSYRFVILGIFCALQLSNALLWVTYAPISDISSHYFGENSVSGSITSINMLANIFLICYGPGMVLSVISMKHYGLRKTLLIASVFNVIGSLLRFIASLFRNSIGGLNTYILMMLGQIFPALSQPMFLNLTPVIASVWFSVSERDVATTIGSMFSPLGNAFGQILPVIFVSEKENTDHVTNETTYNVSGMSDLMLTEFILCFLPLIIAYFFMYDTPPTPPSQSTMLKQKKHSIEKSDHILHEIVESAEEDMISNSAHSNSTLKYNNNSQDLLSLNNTSTQLINEWNSFITDSKILFSNWNYLLLFASFSLGVGFFNSLLTLLNQIIAPHGYTNDDAGTFGAVFIVFGLVGAGVGGYVMEKTRAYRTILKAYIIISFLAALFFLFMLYSDNYWPLLISFGLLGFAVLPVLPVMIENCAETTYPIAEELSMGYLFTGSNVLSIGLVFALQFLLEENPFGPPPLLPSNLFIIGVFVIFSIFVFNYNGPYNRLLKEVSEPLLESYSNEQSNDNFIMKSEADDLSALWTWNKNSKNNKNNKNNQLSRNNSYNNNQTGRISATNMTYSYRASSLYTEGQNSMFVDGGTPDSSMVRINSSENNSMHHRQSGNEEVWDHSSQSNSIRASTTTDYGLSALVNAAAHSNNINRKNMIDDN